MSVSPTTEPHIVVHSDRTVTVPEELKNIAAQFDHNVETVTFDCPRYWDGNDLSAMSVYIIYMRADGETGLYKCDAPYVDDVDNSIMHFKWLLSSDVTAVAGPISFMVSIKKTDENGLLLKRWSSYKNNDCTILRGINGFSDLLWY